MTTLESCLIANLTPDEFRVEWDYRYQERISMLCGTDEPTEVQRQIAADCADEIMPF